MNLRAEKNGKRVHVTRREGRGHAPPWEDLFPGDVVYYSQHWRAVVHEDADSPHGVRVQWSQL